VLTRSRETQGRQAPYWATGRERGTEAAVRTLEDLVDTEELGIDLVRSWASAVEVECEILPPSEGRAKVLLALQLAIYLDATGTPGGTEPGEPFIVRGFYTSAEVRSVEVDWERRRSGHTPLSKKSHRGREG
jgi:hypothetical protein